MTHVLLVDDNPDNLDYLRVLLTAHECQVDTARHGAEALTLARQTLPDIVVSDLLMPVMDGYTLLRFWKSDPYFRDVPFIVYTATYTEADDERLALSLGADAFILKPAEPEKFIAHVREILAKGASAMRAVSIGAEDEKALLTLYSETLIRKLEEKTLQLEEANRVLQEDILQRQKAEAALRERENELSALAESMPQMVWMTGPDGQNIYFNQRWVEFTGQTAEEGRGDGWIEPFHPDDRAGAAEAWKRAHTALADYSVECRIRRDDGAYRWMLIRGLPFRNQEGEIVKWMGTCTDIHDLKEANTMLREQASLLDLAQDAIVVRDLEHKVLFWNRSAERLYGWTAAEALGRSVLELAYDKPTHFLAAVKIALETGDWVGEIEQTTKSGKKLTAEGHWTLVRDEAGKPKAILSINTDITSRKQMESQFLRAQRLESIGTLAGGIAHDFNNLLAPIVMGVSFLKRFETRENVLKVIRNIERSADRGKELVRQVLSFARGVEGARITLDLGHIVREVESIAMSTFPKDIRVERRIADGLWLVDGDPTQLHQVILNLCVNSRDAMPDGGRLVISADNVVVDEQYAVMNQGVKAGRFVVLEVRDEGSGIPRDVQDRMFEPFFTTKDLGKGTGLGLSTVLGIVRGHGGFIDVDSEPGKGTSFKAFIPAQLESVTKEAPLPGAEELPMGGGELILVVDDELSILDITKQTLEGYGYRAMVAEDGAKAIEIYADNRDEIAAVITDIMMPIMDGPALIAALRRLNPEVLIIAVSGLEIETEEKRNGIPGVKAFLKKPFTAQRLLMVLRSLLTKTKDER